MIAKRSRLGGAEPPHATQLCSGVRRLACAKAAAAGLVSRLGASMGEVSLEVGFMIALIVLISFASVVFLYPLTSRTVPKEHDSYIRSPA